MKEKIIQLIKENIELWYNKENNTIEINGHQMAKHLEEFYKDEVYEELVKTVSFAEIGERAKMRAAEQDYEGMSESVSGEDLYKEIYVGGYYDGYLKAYEDITGMEHPLE